MEEKHSFFVGIKDPIEVRKTVLECTKDTIMALQDYEKLRDPREEKIKKMLELKHLFEDIEKLNADLKTEFPKADIKFKTHEKPAQHAQYKPKKDVEVKQVSHPSGKEKITKKEFNELDRLETELNMIEHRLNKLSG